MLRSNGQCRYGKGDHSYLGGLSVRRPTRHRPSPSPSRFLCQRPGTRHLQKCIRYSGLTLHAQPRELQFGVSREEIVGRLCSLFTEQAHRSAELRWYLQPIMLRIESQLMFFAEFTRKYKRSENTDDRQQDSRDKAMMRFLVSRSCQINAARMPHHSITTFAATLPS